MDRISIIKILACLSLLFILSCCNSYAGEPFDWMPAPPGAYLTAYPVYYHASRLTDRYGKTATDKLGLTSYQVIPRMTYYNRSTFPHTWAFTAYLPIGRTKLLGDTDSGIGDLTVAAGYWIIDDNASRTYLLAGSFFDLPTGHFDKNKIANMGSNVYKFRPIVAFAKTFGAFHAESAIKYNIYTREHETGIRAGDEIISETYAGYFVRPDFVIGGHFNAIAGKSMAVLGTDVPGSGIRRYQAGPSVLWVVNPSFYISLGALDEFSTRNSPEGYLLISRFTWKP